MTLPEKLCRRLRYGGESGDSMMLLLGCGVTIGDPSRLVDPRRILRSCVSRTSISPLRFSANAVIRLMVLMTASTVGTLAPPRPAELEADAILVFNSVNASS